MNQSATIYDMPLSTLRAQRERRVRAATPQPASVFEDLADGALVADYALTCAGFDYEARQLVVSLVGLAGARGELKVFDEELSAHLKCSDRTVRRWRAAYLAAVEARRFAPLRVVEGEYDRDAKRYLPTLYAVAPETIAFVNMAVAEARASDLYATDRRAALERAAEEYYDEIPDAPPRRRQHKPHRSPTVRLERDFENAKRNVERGRQTLLNLPPRTRAAFLASRQGAELRQLLEELKGQIDEVLGVLPPIVENTEVEDIPDILSGIPPVEDTVAEADGETDDEGETRVRDIDIDNTRTQDAEAWASVFAGLRVPPVVSRSLDLAPRGSPPSDASPPTLTNPAEVLIEPLETFRDAGVASRSPSIEELEAEAVRAEGCRELSIEYDEGVT